MEIPSAGTNLAYTTVDGGFRVQIASSNVLLDDVASLHTDDSVVQIDLSEVATEGNGTPSLDDVAATLFPLVIKPKIQKIHVPAKWALQLQGKCKGLLGEAVVKALDTRLVLVLQYEMRLRDILDFSHLTRKITCHSEYNTFDQGVIDTLLHIGKDTSVPFPLVSAVTRAYKCLRKRRRLESENASKCKMRCFTQEDVVMQTAVSSSLFKRATNEEDMCKDKDAEEQEEDEEGMTDLVSDAELASVFIRYKRYKCYICKTYYNFPNDSQKITNAWKQYPRLCFTCAKFNFTKRNQRSCLVGKYAIVTGGRIKIGYRTVLKLLKDGCHVVATTRFPRDAARRFSSEADFETYSERLKIYPLDFKNLSDLYNFVAYIKDSLPHLDILINNAAQTIHRPPSFYQDLVKNEQLPCGEKHHKLIVPCDPSVQCVPLDSFVVYSKELLDRKPPELPTISRSRKKRKRTNSGNFSKNHCEDSDVHSSDLTRTFSPGEKTKRASLNSDTTLGAEVDNYKAKSAFSSSLESTQNGASFFPEGLLDADGQQLDLRPTNTWRSTLTDVPLSELLEVLAINTVAPFFLNQHLHSLITKSPCPRKFIVNVSAMEGQFNRSAKNEYHPHTNMAKAALNMMTRTAAVGYKDEGIYMTSVDTGWVTDERPFHMARHEQQVKGFVCPLDCEDGAARIYDPIVTGLQNNDQTPHCAVFLKDYVPYPW